MNYEKVLSQLVNFINQQSREANASMEELAAREAELEGMNFQSRLGYLEEAKRLEGKIELLERQKACFDELIEGSS